ncbi:MAG TPA: hypothetical protein VL947_06575, partial [Cytophagales bacterium]|nr:hypothetical protein [Cytophagales bacterium]
VYMCIIPFFLIACVHGSKMEKVKENISKVEVGMTYSEMIRTMEYSPDDIRLNSFYDKEYQFWYRYGHRDYYKIYASKKDTVITRIVK